MNENPNNRSGIPQKQINRVVAPIQVDQNGNKLETPVTQPKIVNTSIREVVNPNGGPKLPPEKPKKEHDQTHSTNTGLPWLPNPFKNKTTTNKIINKFPT